MAFLGQSMRRFAAEETRSNAHVLEMSAYPQRVRCQDGNGVTRSDAEVLRLLREKGLQVPEVFDHYADPRKPAIMSSSWNTPRGPFAQVIDVYGSEGKKPIISQL